MIKDTLKSYKSDNRGSAIITGLVVSAVLMVLCLSLLLVAYSLFISTSKNTSDLPDREMLYSAAEALEHELLDFTAQYDNDTLTSDLTGRDFWKYINDNIWQGFDSTTGVQSTTGGYWLYFDRSATSGDHADLEKCSKYFNISSIGSVKVVVQLYWELPKGFINDKTNKDKTILNAVYRMYNNKGEVLIKTERKYIMSKSINTTNNSEQPPSAGPVTLYTSENNSESVTLNIYKNKDGCNGSIVIINNSNIPIKNWSIVVVTNIDLSKAINSGPKVEKVSNTTDTYRISPSDQYDIIYGYGSNKTISFNDNQNIMEYTLYLIEYNDIPIPHNGTESGSSNSFTIRWTRIGEEIINPGGGN